MGALLYRAFPERPAQPPPGGVFAPAPTAGRFSSARGNHFLVEFTGSKPKHKKKNRLLQMGGPTQHTQITRYFKWQDTQSKMNQLKFLATPALEIKNKMKY